MSGDVTICFYLVIGVCVAVAVWLGDTNQIRTGRWFRVFTAIPFWPMYLPLLLSSKGRLSREEEASAKNEHSSPPAADEMAVAITQVEAELDKALCSLNGWAEDALCAEADRFTELRCAWRQQAERIRELDRLLATTDVEATRIDAGSAPAAENLLVAIKGMTVLEADSSSAKRITFSEQSRRENLSKLKRVRQQWHDDLLATLASVRQLVTMIHLARYTGEPASRAAELVEQIAHTVEGLTKGASGR
ncbi:MAG: hypothetical protein V4719_31915 [Planctomycetota bacterium]